MKIFGIYLGRKTKKVVLGGDPQTNKLVGQMEEKNLTHGETIVANLKRVKIKRNDANKEVLELYFCPIENLEVIKQITDGDRTPLPRRAIIVGKINIPKNAPEGYYDLKNVQITSNGTIQLSSTKNTSFDFVQTNDF